MTLADHVEAYTVALLWLGEPADLHPTMDACRCGLWRR